MPEGVYAGWVGVINGMVRWMAMESWEVYQQQMCTGATEMFCKGLIHYSRWVTLKDSFATQNKTYININIIYVNSMG